MSDHTEGAATHRIKRKRLSLGSSRGATEDVLESET